MAGKDFRINGMIRVAEVRLLGEEGEQLGVVSTLEALKMAEEQGLDLVEIAPQGQPPVCRIVDFGKFKFELEKKNRETRKNQKQVKQKEVRMQMGIDEHDLEFKTKHVREFLAEGNKVKVSVRFRGRQMAHVELGAVVLERVQELLGEGVFVVEKPPLMEGRMMSMSIAPKNKSK
ncbi:MAG: translation initiation factor IF-3 [Spirochaetia bacterium]